jgi:hypothetical protein
MVPRILTTLLCLILTVTLASAQSPKWVVKRWSNDHAPILNWINTECAPKDASGIVGAILSEGPPSHDYVIYVWCRQDKSSVQWEGTSPPFQNQWEVFIMDGIAAGSVAMIGIIKGQKGDSVIAFRRK